MPSLYDKGTVCYVLNNVIYKKPSYIQPIPHECMHSQCDKHALRYVLYHVRGKSSYIKICYILILHYCGKSLSFQGEGKEITEITSQHV